VSESLALKLRVLRAEQGLTIEEAAARAGVAPETISDAERGRRHPYLPTLRKIAKGYGVPVEELLSVEDPAPLGDAPSGTSLYAYTDKPRFTRAELHAHGIPATESETIVLNQYLHVRQNPPDGPYAIGYVKKGEDDNVDYERVKTMLALVLHLLDEDEVAAVHESLRRELFASSAGGS